MTKDDIIRLVREAGMTVYEGAQDRVLFDGPSIIDSLERFAALVAAHERDECAKIIEKQDVDPAFKNRMASAIRARGEQ